VIVTKFESVNLCLTGSDDQSLLQNIIMFKLNLPVILMGVFYLLSGAYFLNQYSTESNIYHEGYRGVQVSTPTPCISLQNCRPLTRVDYWIPSCKEIRSDVEFKHLATECLRDLPSDWKHGKVLCQLKHEKVCNHQTKYYYKGVRFGNQWVKKRTITIDTIDDQWKPFTNRNLNGTLTQYSNQSWVDFNCMSNYEGAFVIDPLCQISYLSLFGNLISLQYIATTYVIFGLLAVISASLARCDRKPHNFLDDYAMSTLIIWCGFLSMAYIFPH
jgi:hypothetical protein